MCERVCVIESERERESAPCCDLFLPFSCSVTEFVTNPENAIRSCAAMGVFLGAIFAENEMEIFEYNVRAPDAAYCTPSHFDLYRSIRADEEKCAKLRLFLSPMKSLGLFRLDLPHPGAPVPVSATPTTATAAGGGRNAVAALRAPSPVSV